MDVKKYIESGILELYVAGQLTDKQNLEVAELMNTYPEIRLEVLDIEAAILHLSEKPAAGIEQDFESVKKKIGAEDGPVVIDLPKEGTNWYAYMGWAASVILAVGLFYFINQNQKLQSEMEAAQSDLILLEQQIAEANESVEKAEELLGTLRDKNITVVPLQGQTVAPEAYARVYWNKEQQKIFVDALGLPDPPEGMAYQVWSLTLDPLTPTSVGLLEDFTSDENRIFVLSNINESEAFGITLEPAGGSSSPNLDQLYALGTTS